MRPRLLRDQVFKGERASLIEEAGRALSLLDEGLKRGQIFAVLGGESDLRKFSVRRRSCHRFATE